MKIPGIINNLFSRFLPTPEKQWDNVLRSKIFLKAREHAFGNSCEIVQLETLEELGFDSSALLMGLHGHRSGIPAKIAMLDALANAVPQYVRVLNPEQAQAATNQSTGQYLVLAFMWDTIHAGGAEVEKHHAAIVIGGKFNSVDGPAMGGGGLNMQKIDKGWVLSNARIHFTEWGKVKYYQYGYRTDRRIV